MKGGLSTNLLLLLFCILFSVRAFGYQSGIEYILSMNFTSEVTFTLMLTAVAGAFLGITVGAGIISRLGGSSFSVIYIIPAMAMGVIFACVITPIGFLIDVNIPDFLKIFLMGIIYIMMMGAAEGFVRGMDV